MNVSTAIKTRRSINEFDPAVKMSEQEIETLLSHAILSPTCFNIQHWRFVRIADPALRQQARQIAWNQSQVTDASLLLVICMDLMAWDKDPARYWRNAPEPVQENYVKAMRAYYAGNERAQRDEGMVSCGIAAMNLMLMARELGYDSCPMEGFDKPALAKLINLPDDHEICMMLAIGKQAQGAFERGGQLPLDEVVFTDRFK